MSRGGSPWIPEVMGYNLQAREARVFFSAREARRNAQLDSRVFVLSESRRLCADSDGKTISARSARFFSAREARRNAPLDSHFCSRWVATALRGFRRSWVIIYQRGLYLRRAKRAVIFSAREARRNARLDLRVPFGVGRGWVAAARHKQTRSN